MDESRLFRVLSRKKWTFFVHFLGEMDPLAAFLVKVDFLVVTAGQGHVPWKYFENND